MSYHCPCCGELVNHKITGHVCKCVPEETCATDSSDATRSEIDRLRIELQTVQEKLAQLEEIVHTLQFPTS